MYKFLINFHFDVQQCGQHVKEIDYGGWPAPRNHMSMKQGYEVEIFCITKTLLMKHFLFDFIKYRFFLVYRPKWTITIRITCKKVYNLKMCKMWCSTYCWFFTLEKVAIIQKNRFRIWLHKNKAHTIISCWPTSTFKHSLTDYVCLSLSRLISYVDYRQKNTFHFWYNFTMLILNNEIRWIFTIWFII